MSTSKAAGASKAVVRKGAWTHEEDLLLHRCIEKYGEGKWRQVPRRAGLMRCRKSCRLRWLNYLRPNLKRGDFAEDEIDLVLRLHRLLGNKWSLIAGRIPGRTANDIKNYWNAHLRKIVAAKSSAGTKEASVSGGGADGGSGKVVVVEATRPKNCGKDATKSHAVPEVAVTPNKTTTGNMETTFKVIKPQPRTLTPGVRLAMTPASETRVAGGCTARCSFPAKADGGGDAHFTEGIVSLTPPASDDQIMMWWDSVLEGLVGGGDDQIWGSGSEGDIPAESLFRDEGLCVDDEEENNTARLFLPPSISNRYTCRWRS